MKIGDLVKPNENSYLTEKQKEQKYTVIGIGSDYMCTISTHGCVDRRIWLIHPTHIDRVDSVSKFNIGDIVMEVIHGHKSIVIGSNRLATVIRYAKANGDHCRIHSVSNRYLKKV